MLQWHLPIWQNSFTMQENKILGNPERKSSIDDLLERAGKDKVIQKALGKKEPAKPPEKRLVAPFAEDVIYRLKQIDSVKVKQGIIRDIAVGLDGRIEAACGQWHYSYILKDGKLAPKDGNFMNKVNNAVTAVAFSPDGKYYAEGVEVINKKGRQGLLYLYDLPGIPGSGMSAGTVPNVIKKIEFSSDSSNILLYHGNKVRIVRFEKSTHHVNHFLERMLRDDTDVALSPDGKYLACGWDNVRVYEIPLQKPRMLKLVVEEDLGEPIKHVSFSPLIYSRQVGAQEFNEDYYFAAAGDRHFGIFRFSSNDNSLEQTSGSGFTYGKISSIALDPGGIAVTLNTEPQSPNACELFTWGFIEEGKIDNMMGRSIVYYGHEFTKAKFSANGKYLAAAAGDGAVILYGVERRKK